MKRKLSTLILFVILLAGVGLLLYPTVSDYWNSFHQSRAIATYAEQTVGMSDEEYAALFQPAYDYNAGLLEKQNPLMPTDEEIEAYEQVLNLQGTGVMAYIEIPRIECTLPIYHGVSESVLQIAVGHITGTSLPVGGESTHCVLSGHRGLPSAKLFTNLDQVEVGDIFMIQVLNETLTYEVDQIRIVEPQEVDDLAIIRGEDHCTLVTCTPYGINTHRLLVRGKRIENLAVSSTIRVTAEAMKIDPILVAPVAATPMLLVLGVLLMTSTPRKRKP